ncbi:MAG: hypothetical protein O3A20_03705 [Planctomycetota bacterium]|nr:hypothetical protein [Planctomycetota bacterium]
MLNHTAEAVASGYEGLWWTDRLGTWIRAASPSADDLSAALRAGDAFFGDPFRFDPDGEFLLDEEAGNYSMGDVVRTPGRVEQLRVRVRGCRPGDSIRILRNGTAGIVTSEVRSTEGSLHLSLPTQPGDWVRAELVDPAGQPILFSNPIYYVAVGDPVPLHRAP